VTGLSSISEPVGLGVIGLGRAFALSARAIHAHPGVKLVAAAAPRAESRDAFSAVFDGNAYDDVERMVSDSAVEAVYVTTPHHMHLQHALAAIAAGKHVLVEKPMTVTLEDADRMIGAADEAGVWLLVGPSHSFDGPVALAAGMIAEGAIGRVHMIHALYATDFLYRPRRGDELSTDLGGGVIFSQAIHQVDLVRRLAGKPAIRVTARTGGAWDPSRPTEGAYTTLIDFEDDVFASLTYSGYAHFDGDRLMDNISELGCRKPDTHVSARDSLRTISDESAAKRQRGFTRLEDCPDPVTHEHFGQVLVFGERGDLRLTAGGVELSSDSTRSFFAAPFSTSRAEVFDALRSAIRDGEKPLQDGRYGRASLEICHALLDSEARRESVALHYQTGARK